MGCGASPETPWECTIVYEAHVRGLTKLHPDIPEALRGTYLGLANLTAGAATVPSFYGDTWGSQAGSYNGMSTNQNQYQLDGSDNTSIDLAALSVVAFVQDGGYVPATAQPAAETAGESVSPGAALVQTASKPQPTSPARPVAASGLAINVLQTAKADVIRKGGGD